MKLGIVGLPKVGKTTLFNLMTASREETGKFATSDRTHVAVARVPDRRLERLSELFQPRRTTPATVEYVDIPGIQKGGDPERLDLPRLRTVDALVHVLRAFEDPELPHPEGSVDPARDDATMELELILSDHDVVTRRLERLAAATKRGLKPEELRERALLSEAVVPALEAEIPLRAAALGDDERLLRGFGLLSAKPMLRVVNVAEAEAGRQDPARFGVTPRPGTEAVVVSAPIEAEIAALPVADQAEFLAALGLAEPGLDRVIQASYHLLGLLSFFTVGEDEVRAWTVRRGTRAREAAGTIHSDLERGFIRAEVVGWEELMRLGTLARCRSEGVLRLEGKDYEVRDGDVMHVRFAV